MTADLAFLQRHADKLTPDERRRLLAVLRKRERGFRSNRYIAELFPKIHEKQREFLGLDCNEAFFGGSAGGGKSIALFMAAMQYCDLPNYSAIIFRKTYTDLTGEDGLMDVARKLLSQTDAKWSEREKSWFFPSGARIAFGYMDHPDVRYRYQGWRFDLVCFDELSHFPEECYTYLFSRVRRAEGSSIPPRMRAASNPGGVHGSWVRERFIPQEYLDADPDTRFSHAWTKAEPCGDCGATGKIAGSECMYCEGAGEMKRWFVPARVEDNPSMDQQKYAQSLSKLGYVERQQLQRGDWTAYEEGGLFRSSWFRFYSTRGEHFILHEAESDGIKVVSGEAVEYFITADTASKDKTSADWTVIAVWALDLTNYNLMLVHVHRERMDIPAIFPALYQLYYRFRCTCAVIEDAASGIAVIQQARAKLAVIGYNPHTGDKVSRSTTAQVRCEAGQVYLPVGRHLWVDEFVQELVQFPVGEHDDQVDCLSQAAWFVNNRDKTAHPSALPQQVSSGPVSAGYGPVGFGRR